MEEPLAMESTRRKLASPLCFDWPEATDDIDDFLDPGDIVKRSSDCNPANVSHLVVGSLLGSDTLWNDKDASNISSTAPLVATKRRLSKSDPVASIRRKKKPKGMPKRPLSAYNLYFQFARTSVQARSAEEEGPKKLGFEGLGKIIGKQWRQLSDEDRKKYEILAEKDSVRYRKEMAKYNQEKSTKIANDDKKKLLSSMGGQNISDASFGRNFFDSSSEQKRTSGNHSFSARPQDCGNSLQVECLPAIFEGREASLFDAAVTPPVQRPKGDLSFPLPPPERHACDGNNILLPPHMEIILSDRNGKDRRYSVEYKCYSMSRSEAHEYIESVTGSLSNQPSTADVGIGSSTKSSNTERPTQFCAPWENELPRFQ